MAKWHNTNVRLHSLARKWFNLIVTHLYIKVFSQETYLKRFNINFCTWVEVNDKNIGKMKCNQHKITDLSILVHTIYITFNITLYGT